MARTHTEKVLANRAKATRSKALLVPIMENLLEREVIPENPDDFAFMNMLVHARALPRKKGVYSPSMLGSCIRQAYLSKRGEHKKETNFSAQTHYYFLTGNFVHFKWQFAIWKAHQAGLLELVPVPIQHEFDIIDDLSEQGKLKIGQGGDWKSALDFYGNGTRPGVEVRVTGQGDVVGTIDVLVRLLHSEPIFVVDFKGINLIDYQRTVRSGAKKQYRVQIVGYADNVNTSDLPFTVDEALLVSECKAGPVPGSGSPIALHETRVPVKEHIGEVKRRLKTLRFYDGRNEMPPPECVSTLHSQFQECPFSAVCRDEVKLTQKEREASAKATARSTPRTVARPGR